MPNRLIHESSPYLLQHATNPVDWYPWGEEALARARAEDKPIFLSIGYAACHWCHVMERESFEDPKTADLLNEHFVCIKVDREQRPDIDGIYMQATTTLTGSGGWPLSVFLTPDLRPFYAGTYFPAARRYGSPAFSEVLLSLARIWREKPDDVTSVAAQVVENLRRLGHSPLGELFTEQTLGVATGALLDAYYDWEHGGWGAAPKFPQAMAIEFLLRRSVGAAATETGSRKAALHALEAMARGGMYDVIGGGFSRYSTDELWRVPHFEKMLYDNAQLALAYVHAWQITRDPFYKRVSVDTLEFVIRELTHPHGGFYSSLDADSDGEEGEFYAWTKEQIRAAVPDPVAFELFTAAYGITSKGNWEGRIVLQRSLDNDTLAARFRLESTEVASRLEACQSKLLEARNARPRPATDDKVLTAWNGLMLQAFAQAARVLDEHLARKRYLEVATRNADFILRELRPSGRLSRSWRQGRTIPEVFLEDFASLILGLLDLYQSDFDDRWFSTARDLADEMLARFSDPDGGFFDVPNDATAPLVRPKDLQDSAIPSGNAMAVEALLELADLTNDSNYREAAERALRLVTELAPKYPISYARWLACADRAVKGSRQLAVVFAPGQTPGTLLDVVHEEFRPNLLIAASSFPPSEKAPDLLAGRPLIRGLPTAYLCSNFVCRAPTTDPTQLREQL